MASVMPKTSSPDGEPVSFNDSESGDHEEKISKDSATDSWKDPSVDSSRETPDESESEDDDSVNGAHKGVPVPAPSHNIQERRSPPSSNDGEHEPNTVYPTWPEGTDQTDDAGSSNANAYEHTQEPMQKLAAQE